MCYAVYYFINMGTWKLGVRLYRGGIGEPGTLGTRELRGDLGIQLYYGDLRGNMSYYAKDTMHFSKICQSHISKFVKICQYYI
jgi:hypothetical protein